MQGQVWASRGHEQGRLPWVLTTKLSGGLPEARGVSWQSEVRPESTAVSSEQCTGSQGQMVSEKLWEAQELKTAAGA